jgi:hypothetical protein
MQTGGTDFYKRKTMNNFRFRKLGVGDLPYKRIFFIFYFGLILSACKDDDVKILKSRDGSVTFTLPSQYQTSDASAERLTFALHYPSKIPIAPGKASEADQILIFIMQIDSARAIQNEFRESWEKQAGSNYDPNRPGRHYRYGEKGPYRIYYLGPPEKIPPENVYYFFRAKDGQNVLASERDGSVLFKIQRRIGDYFEVQYLVAKNLGRDFEKIDQDVTEFLQKQIKKN